MPVLPHDILITATDGLFDNVFFNDIVHLCNEPSEGASPLEYVEELCQSLGAIAKANSNLTTGSSPFSKSALKHGYKYPGGKPDDITIITSILL